MNEALKIARINERAATRAAVLELLKHPVYSVVLSVIVIELLQAQKVNGQPLVGSVAGSLLEGALLTQGTLAALAKSGAMEGIMSALITKNPAGLLLGAAQ